MQEGLADTLSSVPITIGVHDAGHRLMGCRVVEQPRGFGHDALAIGPHKPGSAGLNAFRPFDDITEHQDRKSETGSFLLEASRVGKQQIARLHQVDHVLIVERGQQENARRAIQLVMDRSPYFGVPVAGCPARPEWERSAGH